MEWIWVERSKGARGEPISSKRREWSRTKVESKHSPFPKSQAVQLEANSPKQKRQSRRKPTPNRYKLKNIKVVPQGRMQGDGRPKGIPNSSITSCIRQGFPGNVWGKVQTHKIISFRDENWAPWSTPILDMSTQCLPHPTSSLRWNCPTHSPLYWEAEVGLSLPRDGSWLDQ